MCFFPPFKFVSVCLSCIVDCLQPGNILLSGDPKDPVPKITDFGIANADKSEMSTFCGTVGYAAPEVIKRGDQLKYGKEVDMYALGIILYMILCGKHPHEDQEDSSSQVPKVFKFEEPEWKSVSFDARDLIMKLIDKNPLARLDAGGALKHRWLCMIPPATEEFAAPSSPLKKRANVVQQNKPALLVRTLSSSSASSSQSSSSSPGKIVAPATPPTKRKRVLSFSKADDSDSDEDGDSDGGLDDLAAASTIAGAICTPPPSKEVLVPKTGSQKRLSRSDSKGSVKPLSERLTGDEEDPVDQVDDDYGTQKDGISFDSQDKKRENDTEQISDDDSSDEDSKRHQDSPQRLDSGSSMQHIGFTSGFPSNGSFKSQLVLQPLDESARRSRSPSTAHNLVAQKKSRTRRKR